MRSSHLLVWLALLSISAGCAAQRPWHKRPTETWMTSDGSDSNSDSNSDSGNSGGSDSGGSDSGNSGASDSGGSDSGGSDSGGSDSGNSGSGNSSDPGASNSDTQSHVTEGEAVAVLSTTTVAATVAGIGLTIWGVRESGEDRQVAARAAHDWLLANEHQLKQDLAIGAGPSVEDLASAARIRPENLGRFGQILREHRAEILTMSRPETLTPERALHVMRRIGDLARTDAAIALDAEAFTGEAG